MLTLTLISYKFFYSDILRFICIPFKLTSQVKTTSRTRSRNMKIDVGSLYNQCVNDLFTYGLYLGFDENTVKDAIHDVFVKITSESERLTDIDNIKFYLFRSLKNRLFDIYKKEKRHTQFDQIININERPFTIHVNVEDLLIEKEEKQQIKNEIEQMLDALTSRQREIIYLRYVQEYDYEQISELLQISVHGCRKLVSKAILSLREKFGTFTLLLTLLS